MLRNLYRAPYRGRSTAGLASLGIALGLWVIRAQTAAPPPQSLASVRIVFGLTDTAIQGLRLGPEGFTDYAWSRKGATRAQGAENVFDNGVIVTARSQPASR